MARGVFHADAKLAPERGIAQRILVLLVGEIRDTAVEPDAVTKIVRSGEIDASIASVVRDAVSEKIAVGASAGEIARNVPVHSFECRIQHEIAGIYRAPEQTIARNFRGIKCVWRSDHAC